MLYGMSAIIALVAHFYAAIRHMGGLHWFHNIGSGMNGIRAVAEAHSRFFADLSHELQTPIAILRGNLEILAGRRGGSRKAALAVMGATTERMARMVDGFLAAARLDFPADELRREEFVLADLLAEIHDDCAALAEDKGIDFRRECATTATVVADRDKMREVVLNLISNALKHTARGGEIRLSGRVVADGSARAAEIAVEDTGCGIAPELLGSIFERFYRVEGDAATGTGLGLHICRKIVEAHGGHITAESEPGEGSRFTVFLSLSGAV